MESSHYSRTQLNIVCLKKYESEHWIRIMKHQGGERQRPTILLNSARKERESGKHELALMVCQCQRPNLYFESGVPPLLLLARLLSHSFCRLLHKILHLKNFNSFRSSKFPISDVPSLISAYAREYLLIQFR